jgi:monoamine oxidase
MPRSHALRALARLAAVHAAADSEGVSAGRIRDEMSLSRRDFARGLLAASATLPLLAGCSVGQSPAANKRVAIIGAGIAGLTAALRLQDAGIASTVYESSSRIGGRMHSEWSYWNDRQHTEWCGAMIDTQHVTMHALARRFHLPLGDTYSGLKADDRDTAFLDGHYYPMPEADRDFAAIYPILKSQLAAMPATPMYSNMTAAGHRLDQTSMAAWIDRYVPGGLGSRLGKLIKEAYRNEYGREIEEQSSLNLVCMLGIQRHFERDGKMSVLGYSDQRFYIAAGNQRLPLAIAAALPAGTVQFGHRMVSIKKLPGGLYELQFDNNGATVKETYERVVIAIPFIVLRGLDYSSAGFDAAKHRAIQELGYGYHTKLHVQFDGRPWRKPGSWPGPTTGQIWTTLPFQSSVDFSLGQAGPSGIIERFTGAGAALIDTPPMPYARIGDSDAVKRQVKHFFEMLDEIWPGCSKQFNGKATFGNAQADPNILASYSCWLTGQYSTIAGTEGLRQGNVHFAGEHTSVEHQGFMEGGAESGVRVAAEILSDLKS